VMMAESEGAALVTRQPNLLFLKKYLITVSSFSPPASSSSFFLNRAYPKSSKISEKNVSFFFCFFHLK